MQIAGGAATFGLFMLIFFIAVTFSLYSRRGSGINQRPYRDPHGDAPGATGPSTIGHDATAFTDWTRGTR